MQLKLALAVCTVTACTLCGRSLAAAAERRKIVLDGLVRALGMLCIQVTDMLEPLPSALRQADHPLLSSVAERLSQSESVSDAWRGVRKDAVRRGGMADSLTEHDLEMLDRLFDSLGASGREVQKNSIQGCAASMEEALAGAKERAGQVGRLYTSIGFLAGLATVILMI